MKQVSPSEWGARVNYDSWNNYAKDKWILHYNGPAAGVRADVGSEMAFLRGIENYHMDSRGWRGIAYSYAIGQTGTLYRLRGESWGGHTRGDYEPDSTSENQEGRAVFFMIGDDEEPTEAALQTFAQFWAEDPMPVIGHKQVFEHSGDGTDTQCPGPHLMEYINTKGYEMALSAKTIERLEALVHVIWEDKNSNAGLFDFLIDDIRSDLITRDELNSALQTVDDIDQHARKVATSALNKANSAVTVANEAKVTANAARRDVGKAQGAANRANQRLDAVQDALE